MRQPLLIYVSLALLTFVLTGVFVEQQVSADDESYRFLSNFYDTLDLIQKNYVDEVSLDHLIEGAYRGLIEELDADSYFLSAAQHKRWEEASRARPRAAIGAVVSKRHGYAVVVSVLPANPAAASLATGDYIRLIDGRSTREMNLFEIEQRLAGEAGSEVKLKVVRRENLGNDEIVLRRSLASYEPLEREVLADGVLVLRPRRIDAEVTARIARDLATPGTRAVVLDLRGCALGRVWDGAPLADLFLDSGTLLRLRGKTNESTVKRAVAPLGAVREAADGKESATSGGGFAYRVAARPDDTVWRGPLVVLIDGGTAGASEVATAALKENGRAAVVGVRSFGRGSIQDLIPLDGGNALHLSIAQAVTPNGSSLLAKGLEPDDVVETARTSSTDPVMDKALERLRSDASGKKAA